MRFGILRTSFVLAILPLGLKSTAIAGCTGASPTWTSTPDQASVTACVNNARSGDTINVLAGSATWTGNIDISNKSLAILGAGAGNTVITGQTFTLTANPNASRISGFTFNIVGGTYFNVDGVQGWRIDHNTFVRTSWDFTIFAVGSLNNGRSTYAVEGLIDHNTFINSRVVVYGEYSDTGGSDRWVEPLNLGTAHAVYVEDNTFTITDSSCLTNGVIACNSVDANNGGRYVARFNTLNNSYFESHSLACASGCRGTRVVEIYDNKLNLTNIGGYSRPFFLRAGTGMVFHNSSIANYSENRVNFNNLRSCENLGGWGYCAGTSSVDGNVAGQVGYACRDQIGRSTDASYWNYSSSAPVQQLFPMYLWRNTSPSGEQTVVVAPGNCDSTHQANQLSQIQANRDYFQYNSSFIGTSGVGEGPLANRPATCSLGVGYWATDQGSWNQSGNNAGQGHLYTCTGASTWSLTYTPYTYPHPLQGGGSGGTTSVLPPTNLQTTAQ